MHNESVNFKTVRFSLIIIGDILNDILNHCRIGIRAGEHNISSPIDCEEEEPGVVECAPPYQDVAVAAAIPHPLYNPVEYTNDIGLIRLAAPLNMSVGTYI